MKTTTQTEGYISLNDIKPSITKEGVKIPVKVEHVNLDKYHGDARSFGYHYDEGFVTVITYEVMVGVLAEDVQAKFFEAQEFKRMLNKPKISTLEKIDSDLPCDVEKSELLTAYDDNRFYKDEHGYWLQEREVFDVDFIPKPYRVDDESAEIYRACNKVYCKEVKQYNAMMEEVMAGIKALKEIAG